MQTVSSKLQLRLSGKQEQQLAKSETLNPDAYEMLLKGNFYWEKGDTGNRRKALGFYEQAVSIEPNYALAYVELSIGYQSFIGQGDLDPQEWTPRAQEAVRKALELDENLPEAHLAQAENYRYTWRWQEADEEFRRTLELNPNSARARSMYGRYLSVVGRHDEAVNEYTLARELDPLSLSVNSNFGMTLAFARRFDEGIETCRKTLAIDPEYPSAYVNLGYNYTGKGMYREGIEVYEKAVSFGDDSTSLQISLGSAYARAGNLEKARRILHHLETGKQYAAPGELAILYGDLGERDKAFATFEKAYDEHDLQLQFIGVNPDYDTFRSDARFQDLIRRIGLPQQQTANREIN